MRKKAFLIIFIFLTSFHPVYVYDEKNLQEKNSSEIISETKIWKVTKKEIKREIKNRKRYHKNLLEKYNSNFDKKILDFIQENSLILTKLRKQLKK